MYCYNIVSEQAFSIGVRNIYKKSSNLMREELFMTYIKGYSLNNKGCVKTKSKKSGLKLIFNFTLVITLILFVTLILISGFSLISFGEDNNEILIHEVESGDTLWTIATLYYDNNIDIRKAIYNIKKANDIDSAIITPGKKLIIPINK